jgi:hypothetical protein
MHREDFQWQGSRCKGLVFDQTRRLAEPYQRADIVCISEIRNDML